MFDRRGIYLRFSSCYPELKLVDLARLLGVTPQILDHWKTTRRPIPWRTLKKLVDEQDLSWDWLLEGKEPKHRQRGKRSTGKTFDRKGINDRFLSLYLNYSQERLGKELGINGTTVFKWRHYMSQVPWNRLKHAVDTKGVTWEWLIEGR